MVLVCAEEIHLSHNEVRQKGLVAGPNGQSSVTAEGFHGLGLFIFFFWKKLGGMAALLAALALHPEQAGWGDGGSVTGFLLRQVFRMLGQAYPRATPGEACISVDAGSYLFASCKALGLSGVLFAFRILKSRLRRFPAGCGWSTIRQWP